MVEWIALGVSIFGLVLTIVLEREKLSRFYTDFYSWRVQNKQKHEGEEFIKSISNSTIVARNSKGLLVVFLTIFFLLLVISSSLVGLLNITTVEEAGAVGTISLSPALWFSLRALWRDTARRQVKWYWTTFMAISFQYAFAGIGLLWGIITMGFLSLNIPLFWAGIAATICIFVILWLIQYKNKSSQG
jgi:hypothetical protein